VPLAITQRPRMTASLPYRVSLLHSAGAEPSAATYDGALKHARSALRDLTDRAELELLTNIARRDDLAAARSFATTLSEDASEIFVLGTGGSSLGGQALAELVPDREARRPRVRFFDNPDPFTYERALKAADLRTTRFLAISKSGGTAETLMQVLAAADALRAAGGEKYLARHFAVVTEPRKSPLRSFAEGIGCSILEHPTGIGGRYSVLSVVGLLPAILMGLDAEAIRAGARAVLSHPDAAAEGAALHFALSRERDLRETVLWPYVDRLKTFGGWWRQLWAESLGKTGQGTTPVAALGPVDQHSQLQLFLDGPGGALFTLVTTDTAGKGPAVDADEARALGIAYLAGRHMGDLVDAEARATAETLARRGRPVRVMHVPEVNERAMGALFLHFMLETIVMGRLMGVDPFDQPAVEEGKVLARRYLEESA
jgi:glucose-6-phosphate isomerase